MYFNRRDFNIDLTKMDMRDNVKQYYSTLLSYLFALCMLQPTRPQSKTLIDNIFINTIEYFIESGNMIKLSDHLFQFAFLKDFFFTHSKKHKIMERNFKNFNDRKFLEKINKIDIKNLLNLEKKKDPISLQNLHDQIN